jgi:hypothetical protein
MIRLNVLVCVLAEGIALAASPLLAQTPIPRPGVIPRAATRPRQTPCWEEAGISKSAMERRRQIQQSTRAEVEGVCADSALSMQQKHEKIREIRQRARQEMEGLVTPQQQEALRACQQARSGGVHPGLGGHAGGGTGPCGEVLPSKATTPQHEEPE